MQFCGSPLGSRNPLNTSTVISVNVSSSGEINRLSWIAAYAFYTSWIKMLGLCWYRVCLSFIKRVKPITLPVFHSNNWSKSFFVWILNLKSFCYKVHREFMCDDYCSHYRMRQGHGWNTFGSHWKAGYFGAS